MKNSGSCNPLGRDGWYAVCVEPSTQCRTAASRSAWVSRASLGLAARRPHALANSVMVRLEPGQSLAAGGERR